MNEAFASYLAHRRSIPCALLAEPGPDFDMLRAMLRIAARVPDHGKLAPWRFIVYPGAGRAALVDGLQRIAERHPDEKEGRLRAEKARGWAGTPVIVGVVSAPVADHPKIPAWEQQLSAGAVCLNLLHAAEAHGFSAQWLTGWAAYDDAAVRWLGLRAGERFAGFIHVGTPNGPAYERDRPDLDGLISAWSPDLPGAV